ncbi:MAG: hypothetical protein HYX86_05585 [Chloroflexi bacterium]|nr:hypothetical protein [Chloroflexota bacterium]
MYKLRDRVLLFTLRANPVVRVFWLAVVLAALALAAGAPEDWGGCGCP